MRYDNAVRCDRKNSIVLLLVLLLSALAPEEVECARGADTGQSTHVLRLNCVYALCPTQELEVQAPARCASSTETRLAECRATLGEVFYPACLTKAPACSDLAGLSVSLLPRAARALPLPREVAAVSIEPSSPPLLPTSRDIPSRRAPPVP